MTAIRAGVVKKVDAHIFERQPEEHYVEPNWCDDVLFQSETFVGRIHDPFCGWGRIPAAARRAGHENVTCSDIIDRRAPGVVIRDFFAEGHIDPIDNLVFNPPFNMMEQSMLLACALARRKVAALVPLARLVAAHWLADLPMVQVWCLTPRPSMPPGITVEELMICNGKDPAGGTKDFCWIVFDKSRPARAAAEFGWLHRDRGII